MSCNVRKLSNTNGYNVVKGKGIEKFEYRGRNANLE